MGLNMHVKNDQRGGASIFVVIFAALLMIIVTMSFVQLMISDQKQASTMDLSQSAYDSAQAGVEDAKRALLLYQSCGADSTPQCMNVRAAFEDPTLKCNMVRRALTGSTSDTSETAVRKSGSSNDNDTLLQQAYTCVKVQLNSNDYIKPLKAAGESMLVPLVGESTFNKVRISWFTSDDAGATTATFPSASLTPNLPSLSATGSNEWKSTTPSLLRAQFMQTSKSFSLDQFDGSATGSNANTLFLYPTMGAALSTSDFALDARRDGGAEPTMAKCKSGIPGGAYACEMTITLPDPVSGVAADRSNAFLFLTALYNKSLVRVELLDSSDNVVSFKGVQPQIDSTGRANDVFRRVMTYVEMGSDITYPDSAVQVQGNLCKDFTVTKDITKYNNSCTP